MIQTRLGSITHPKKLYIAGIWLSSVAILGVMEFIGMMDPVRITFQKVYMPVIAVEQRLVAAVVAPIERLDGAFESARKIQDLELRYSEALAEVSLLEGVAAENEALREMLTNSDRTLNEVVLAQPIVSYAQPTVAVDPALVTEGNPVVVGGTVVGRIGRLSSSFVPVQLLTNEDTPGLVVRIGEYEGITRGTGRTIIVSELPRDAEISIGDTIVTLGQPGVPQDLLVGRVAAVQVEPTAAVTTVQVSQLVSFYESRVAEVYTVE